MREREIIRKGDLCGYYDADGEFVVVAEDLTDAEMDRYAAQVQNGDGYYTASGRFKYYDNEDEDEY